MTTNAIDRVKKILASDSRWSIEYGDYVLYVDDTGFDKIADRAVGSIICAGDGVLIDQWRKWFLAPILNPAAMPPTERLVNNGLNSITISYVQRPDGRVRTYNGWYLTIGDDAMFSGSGASPAADCFAKNRCSLTSVESAGKVDPLTGGKTMFVEVETGRNNLSPTVKTLADAGSDMDKRGMVMNTKTGKVSTIKELRADPNSVLRDLSARDLSLSAPTGQKPRAWTQEERDDFRKVMEEAAAIEAKKASND